MEKSIKTYNPVEKELITSIVHGGSDGTKAENLLFTTYDYFISQGMHQFSLSKDEAFDAYADAILVVINHIKQSVFANRSSLKTYLTQIFNNKCVDLIRKKTTNKYSVHQTYTITDGLYQLPDATKNAIQTLMDKTDWELLSKRLLQLGDKCRDLLAMSATGKSDKELATSLNYKTADVVKTSRLRCLEKLRQLYKVNKQL